MRRIVHKRSSNGARRDQETQDQAEQTGEEETREAYEEKLPRPSTTRSTAGPGFDFEDRVGAWFPDSKNDLCGSTLSLCKCLLSYLGRGLGLRLLTRTT